jgi:hypothetical protein
MRFIVILLSAALAGCASQQTVNLLPRGDAERGSGTLDRLTNDLVVTVGDKTYKGKSMLRTATTTSWGFLGPRTSTSYSDQSTALLIGEGGQMRCEFTWDAMMIQATGICVDSKNATYDLLIKNP